MVKPDGCLLNHVDFALLNFVKAYIFELFSLNFTILEKVNISVACLIHVLYE